MLEGVKAHVAPSGKSGRAILQSADLGFAALEGEGGVLTNARGIEHAPVRALDTRLEGQVGTELAFAKIEVLADLALLDYGDLLLEIIKP